jgi:hypothetical protein
MKRAPHMLPALFFTISSSADLVYVCLMLFEETGFETIVIRKIVIENVVIRKMTPPRVLL